MNIRILRNSISGMPFVLGLGTRMSDPYVYVVLKAPKIMGSKYGPLIWVLALFCCGFAGV